MKVRIFFVSNSSSSSFILKKDKITAFQLDQIRSHLEIGREKYPEDFGHNSEEDEWTIIETDKVVKGFTGMDGFMMGRFFELIGIDNSDVDWDSGHMWNDED